MILTDFGKLIIDTSGSVTYNNSDGKYTLKYNNESVTLSFEGDTTAYAKMAAGSARYALYALIATLPYSKTSLTIGYGDAFTVEEGIGTSTNYSLNRVTLPYTITATVYTDETTGLKYITGVLSNGTTENVTIKYLGVVGENMTVYNSSGTGGINIATGVLSYIELAEPITLAPGADYPFKISMNFGL